MTLALCPSGGGQPPPEGSARIPTSAPKQVLAGSTGDRFAEFELNFSDPLELVNLNRPFRKLRSDFFSSPPIALIPGLRAGEKHASPTPGGAWLKMRFRLR
jgi:hypothetical protein